MCQGCFFRNFPLRSAIKKAEENQEVVVLANSTAKKSSFSSETEVHMDKRSKVLESPRLGDIVPFKKAVRLQTLCHCRQVRILMWPARW